MNQWAVAAMLLAGIAILPVAAYLVIRACWAACVNLLAVTMKPGLRHYHANLRSRRWQALRRYVLWRDRRRCRVCGKKFRVLDVHHITPVSDGGSWLTSNLAAVDRACHARLHGRKAW